METRKKINFDFIRKNFSILKGNFLITEVNERRYIGRLLSISDQWLKLDDAHNFEGVPKRSYPHFVFYKNSTDFFLPTSADIAKLGNELLNDYQSIINDTIINPHTVFLEEINQIFGKEFIKKFDDFCNENDIDEKDVWVYLNDKSEKERW